MSIIKLLVKAASKSTKAVAKGARNAQRSKPGFMAAAFAAKGRATARRPR